MTLIDFPRQVPVEAYELAVQRMVERLATVSGVRCIYQIGHVSTPGISDLDLLVVFEDDATCNVNPLHGLSCDDRYLFVHCPFAVTKSNFSEAMTHTFFHNYQLRCGASPVQPVANLAIREERLLKQQIALEYLVRMWVSLSVELVYGVVKLRNLFLHAKALLYDCAFLDISSGDFVDSVQSIVSLRARWFQDRPRRRLLEKEVRRLYGALESALSRLFREHPFYLPPAAEHRLARHVLLVPGHEIQVVHRGMPLPAALGWLGRKYFNCQHRWNRFEFQLPFRSDGMPRVVERGFALRKTMAANRNHRFPHFLTLSSSLAY